MSVCVYLLNCVCVCVCVFIELHITAQSGLVILVILCVCVCVCVVFPFILDVKLVDVPAGVTQEGHTGFLIHLLSAVLAFIFLARRIQPFLSPVDREVEFLCTNELIVLHLFVFFCFFVFFCEEKSQ